MIDVKYINALVESGLKDTGIFLVEAEVKKGNHIRVFIDSADGVTIEECARISRIIETGLNRETEDYDLEVSSPGVDAPLKVIPQYLKNVGREVEVLKKDGNKLTGKLLSTDMQGIIISVVEKTGNKHSKTKEKSIKNEYVSFSDMKSTKVKIMF